MSGTLKARDEDIIITEMLKIVLSHHWEKATPDYRHHGLYDDMVHRGIECVKKTRKILDDDARQ